MRGGRGDVHSDVVGDNGFFFELEVLEDVGLEGRADFWGLH
jgi:hypothetical protein